ncbi:trigger factor [Granulicella tundricola]|uniref:Trigger factor n=1 Tax=Granulicella tundricola (strain ATCC BAA-1859 / DSM 23138 / MP5ACTX9) TaxID=1198114 RepID=E8WW95_GRATM|nr:trigger factor [Granulicella tundricola]ADW68478.1 trigger factor [Granulicella tundricola MP5ACTX9]
MTETEITTATQPVEETNALAETHEHTHDHSHEGHNHEGHVHEQQPTMNPELMREINVEVDADTVSKSFRTVVKKYQKLARIPGFRVGKVPESVIKSRFAKEVRQEVLDELVSERFRLAIVEQKLNPISQPQLTNLMLVDGQPLQFKAAFEVSPEIDIAGYDAVAVEKPSSELTDAEYKAELDRVLDSHGTVETIDEDRTLVDGDWAEIEFKGQIQDVAQTVGEEGAANSEETEEITGEDVLIEIGGSNTLPAFSDALRGQKIGQEMTFEVTYPADFGEPRLAGQTVKYDVTLKTIKKKTFPERDEEFAKQLGDYETWDEFETKLREHAADRKKVAVENQAKDKMLSEMIEKFSFPVPESFVQQQIDARLDRGLRALAQQGMTAEDMRKLDFGRLRAAQRDQAVAEVKASLILDRMAEAEGVQVEDEELEREIMMASLQAREPMETIRQRMVEDGSLERMREQMRREKTGAVVYEKLAK